jgi:hypothetical protein
MADPFFGYIPLSAIAPERLASARVTRGGGAGAFGAGAVAGTIELSSANADQLGLVSASALANDRGETETSGTFAPKLGQGFAVVSGRWDRGQGFWTTPVAQRVPASVRARYELVGRHPRRRAGRSRYRASSPSAGLRGQPHLRFAGADTGSSGQDASLRLIGRGRWQFDVLTYVQARDFNNIAISSTSYRKTLDQRRTPTTGWGGRPNCARRWAARTCCGWARTGAWHRAKGSRMLITRRRARSPRVAAPGRNSDVGLFAEDDWTLGPVILTAGARADRWTIADGHLVTSNAAGVVTGTATYADRAGWTGSFRGGAVIHAGHGLALRAAAYTGLRQPTLNELYRTFTVFPIVTQANPGLRNERLVGYQAGFDFNPIRP